MPRPAGSQPYGYDDIQGYTTMPTHCTSWGCHRGGDKAPLEPNPQGFMVCTRCRTSWGKP